MRGGLTRPVIALAAALAVAGPAVIAVLPSAALAQARDARVMSPAQVRELRRQLGGAEAQRDAARRQAAIARANFRQVAEIFGLAADTPATAVAERLERWAEQDQENREELARLTDIVGRIDSGEVRDAAELHLGEARAAFEDGRLDEADQALARLETLRRSAQTDAADLWIGSVVARAGLARQQWEFERAEALLLEAEQLVERQAERRLFTLRFERAGTAYEQGLYKGDNAALERAIRLYTECLDLVHRADDPDDWASIQNKLGMALATLGNREGGSERLEAAIRAHEAALLERTRERVPLDWASSQVNLGAALATLGEREVGTERLEAAILAYESALLELTPERNPLNWGTTQINLGNVFFELGEREGGVERLEQALDAYHGALRVFRRDQYPLNWAHAQSGIGNGLSIIGQLENRVEILEAAVGSYLMVLLEYTRERVPLYWAETQYNLGSVLAELGERDSGPERLEAAIQAFESALLEQTRERVPLKWAKTQNNLGITLQDLGERESGLERLEAAVRAYETALLELTRERDPLVWAGIQGNLATGLGVIGDRTGDYRRVKDRRDELSAAAEIFDEGGMAGSAAQIREVLALIEESSERSSPPVRSAQ